jgi:hypothetical protein
MQIDSIYITNLSVLPERIRKAVCFELPQWREEGQKGAFAGHITKKLRRKGLETLASEFENALLEQLQGLTQLK